MKILGLLSILTLGALVTGCAQAPTPQDELTARGLQFNGLRLNGVQLQGVQLQGVQLQGILLSGDTPLEGPHTQRPVLEAVEFRTGPIQGTLIGVPQLQGSIFYRDRRERTGHVRGQR